ncbi:hypothetical protein A2Z33_07125 [Candidatus Gottesmanbacteria bacterium RBG_16_52_11]|uniref:Haloacid dehalogenase n=1 Tax=Candidatus Gottesmanbacteria bacterium RBG_16_52_11 TaxID=1798374 RepID=A0A1F5YXW0_9BACT|nr:MAG: hypothetical protein A2Z33_07125 [Candidatus Gottesmanbacteria bacterium RBG_16_52_11]
MKYKALFLDVDGTLVKGGLGNVPTQVVVKAINRISKDVHVCLATGRMLSQIKDIISSLKLSGLLVIANGIQIYDPQARYIVWEKKLGEKSVPAIIRIMKKYRLQTRQFDGRSEFIFDGNTERNDIYSLWADYVSPVIIDKVMHELESIPAVSAHRMISFNNNYECIEAAHAQATKLHGIVEVARRLKIDTKEIIGVGDGYNDFPLLLACGLKIAMGNAVEELKSIADFIAPPVDADGVATVIDKFIPAT